MRSLAVLLPLALAACSDVTNPDADNEEEVITTVVLHFSSTNTVQTFVWSDPENDGTPEIESIVLAAGTTYDLSVEFLNELADPDQDITAEIDDESDEHQVFFTGSAVEGPATGDNAEAVLVQTYADTDMNGLPIGLENTIESLAAGTGSLVVTLRHLPSEDGVAVKVAGLAEDVADGGFAAIGGESDASVTFPVTVQ